MDKTADASKLPVDFEGSLDPCQLPEITLGNYTLMAASEQTTPLATKTSGDRLSPVRGRTMKEYDQQISDLRKENFSLKMRIYYMEERMQQRFGDGQDVFKTNIELQVEIENLKRELSDKQVLVQKAALAMETLTAKHEQEEKSLKNRLLVDCRMEMNQLREQLDKANQSYERSRNDVEDAERKLHVLKEELDDARTELADTRRINQDLSSKVKSTESHVQTLTGQLKLAEQAKTKSDLALAQALKDAEDKLQDAHKQSLRKDRDIQNLSTLLQDQSHVDCTSLLEPVHFQDEYEDLKAALVVKDEQIIGMERQLKDKDNMIVSLENSIENLEVSKKDVENLVEDLQNEIERKNLKLNRFKMSIGGLVNTVQQKDRELKDQQMKLEEVGEEVKLLQESLREMELDKSQAVNNVTSQLAEAEINNQKLRHQIDEANEFSQRMAKSLGKKEAELAGFQEQLVTAIDALNKSEEAVEDLQAQLRTERAEFENRQKEQAVHFQIPVNNKPESNTELEGLRLQIVDLQKLIASQNVELLALARERNVVGDLQDKLKEKDTNIQVLEKHTFMLESHQRETIHMQNEARSSVHGPNVQGLTFDLLQDISMLMDLLRREISSLATLQLQFRDLNTSDHGVDIQSLTMQISSVQRIYKQLEEGVEKNSQLHQTLLNYMREELRLSDSPDSNSCQDGGHNLASSKHNRLSSSPDKRQLSPQKSVKSCKPAVQTESLSSLESEWGSSPVSQSVTVETSPELVDKSLQTGTSFTHVDQWVQTSPRVGEDGTPEGIRTLRGHGMGQEVHVATSVSNVLCPVIRNKLQLVDSDDDVRHHYLFGHHNDSLTDDAKEEHLGLYAESLEDYHNFQHGVYFDQHHIDSHRHDESSSAKSDSKRLSSPGRIFSITSSAHSERDSSKVNGDAAHFDHIRSGDQCPKYALTHLSTPGSDGVSCNGNDLDTDQPDGSSYTPVSNAKSGNGSVSNKSGSKPSCLERSNSQSASMNQHMSIVGNSIVTSCKETGGDCSVRVSLVSLSKSKSESFVEDGDEGKLKECCKDSSKMDLEGNQILENVEMEGDFVDKGSFEGTERGDEWSEKGGKSGRNSWAKELEQYRTQEAGNIGAMSLLDLRQLVTELQMDLVSAVTQNNELQKLLEEANIFRDVDRKTDLETSRQSSVIDYHKSYAAAHNENRKSRIPRPQNNATGHGSPAHITSQNINGSELHSGLTGKCVDEELGVPTDGQLSVHFNQEIDSSKRMSASKAEDIHLDFKESSEQIKELQEKLQASEETVQLLSKQIATYMSTLESAGISMDQMNRSNNQTCLVDTLSKSFGNRILCGGNLSSSASGQADVHKKVDHLLSLSKDDDNSNTSSYPGAADSLERARGLRFSGISSRSDNNTCHSPLVSIMENSASDESSTKEHQGRNIPDFKKSNFPVCVNNLLQSSDPVDAKDRSHHVIPPISHMEDTLSENLKHNTRSSLNDETQADNFMSGGSPHQDYSCKSPHEFNSQSQGTSLQKSLTRHDSLGQSQDNKRLTMDSSVLDHSWYPDVTYSSMLDSTVMSKLLANLEHNLSTLREEAFNTSSLSMEQLQIRVEHLERVNLTLREEIGVYEAINRTQSRHVSPTFGAEFGGQGMSEEDLLKQHLIEIRKLRQRLEMLDVTKDPEQLLIFQSHIQQRIVHQEMIISHLQQQMAEKEDKWQKELSELQRRLSQEKALLIAKLEVTVSDLQRTIHTQASKMEDQERQIINLISELNVKEKHERKKEEEMKKVMHEKVELEADLWKRDKEFLDIERNLSRLEIAKENSESECKRLYSQIEEKDIENEKLRKQVEGSHENSMFLKETVMKCERSLQEKVFTLQKLTNEKTAYDHRLIEKEGQVKNLEAELGILRKEMRTELEEKVGLTAEIDLLREELTKKETKYEFQKVSYEAESERFTEEKNKLRAQLKCKNEEKVELKTKIDELEQKYLGKAALENEIYTLREELKSLSSLQDEVDRLNSELEYKNSMEADLRDRLKALYHVQSEVNIMKEKLHSTESSLRLVEGDKKKVEADLTERDEKVKKRDKQLHHLLCQYKKLDTGFTKQKYALNDKEELVKSLRKQMHLYEVTLTCASQEDKDNIMKQLLKELIATQRQVEDLLSRLEHNSAVLRPTSSVMEGYSLTTTTVDMTTATRGTSRHDFPNMSMTSATTEEHSQDVDVGQLEVSVDERNGRTSEMDQEMRHHSALAPVCSNYLSSHTTSLVRSPSRSPTKQLKYYADSGYAVAKARTIPQGIIDSDIRNLFAVMKLESQEKLVKETGECLVTLSGIEARLDSRLTMYKSKSVSESLDYSTLRETSMSCKNLRVCLEEASRLIATAWVTELPPIDNRGHFYDPVLAEQNKNLRDELAQLCSRQDMFDHDQKDQQQQSRRLNISSENSRQWETSLFKQLHKTSKDLEQAKENIDTSLSELPSNRLQSFSNYSPKKSPRRRLEETM